MNIKVHCRVPIPSQMNALYTLPSFSFKIYFNIILLCMPRSSKCSLSLRFPYPVRVCISLTSHMRLTPAHLTCASHPPISSPVIWSPKLCLTSSINHEALHYVVLFVLQANDRHLLILAELLQLDANEMRSWLCHRKIVSTREVFFKPMTVEEVMHFECCAGQNLVYSCGLTLTVYIHVFSLLHLFFCLSIIHISIMQF